MSDPPSRMDALIETCTDYQELVGAEMTPKNKKALTERLKELTPLNELACFEERKPGAPGRPSHVPTDQTRALVTLMAGMGAIEDDMSKVLGIAKSTMRRHYEAELDSAPARMDFHVYSALYKAIARGKTDMIRLYLERRKGWKADPSSTVTVSVSVAEILREISGQTTGLPDFSTKPKTIEHE